MMSERLSDEAAFSTRVGNMVKRADMSALSAIESEILKYAPNASYDVTRIDGASQGGIGYTELFKSAIYITPLNSELAFYMGALALDDKAERVRIPKVGGDKYLLEVKNLKPSSVAFLPGSNLLQKFVSVDELCKWLYLDKELVIKPHPLTNKDDLAKLRALAGGARVLEPNVSGFELLKNAKRVYSTSASELGLYAKLIGKDVIDITAFRSSDSGAYAPLYRYLNYPYSRDDFLKALSSPLSGVIFLESDFKKGVTRYFERLEDIKTTLFPRSPRDFLEKIRR